MKWFRVLYFVLIQLSSNEILAQTATLKSMDSLFNLFQKNNCFNGDVYISINNKAFYTKTNGYREFVSKENIKHNQVFNVGSISKPFTAVAILQLHQRGLLDINANVRSYLPEFPYNNIFVKHLLSHTAGLRQNFGQIEDLDQENIINNDSILPILKKYKPELFAKPGTEWIYSNIGYELLSIIVERVSKMNFPDYMEKYVFEPADMQRSFIPYTQNVLDNLPKGVYKRDLLVPHEFKSISDCEVSPVDSISFIQQNKSYTMGSENVYSCVGDLAKFDLALRNNKILSLEMQTMAYTPFNLENGEKAKDLNAVIPSYYGLGWFISMDTTKAQIIWHKGRSRGSRSIFLRVPENKQVLSMTDNFDYSAVDLKGISLLRTLNAEPYRNPVLISLVQKLGCEVNSLNANSAIENFEDRKNKEQQNYYISEEEMITLCQELISNNKYADAKLLLHYSRNLFNNSSSIYSEYAKIMLFENLGDSANIYYNKAIELSGEGAGYLNGLGYVFYINDNLTFAEYVLKLNTELYPNTGNVFDSYAFILDKNDKLMEAIITQQKAVKIAIENKDPLRETFEKNLNTMLQKKP